MAITERNGKSEGKSEGGNAQCIKHREDGKMGWGENERGKNTNYRSLGNV